MCITSLHQRFAGIVVGTAVLGIVLADLGRAQPCASQKVYPYEKRGLQSFSLARI